MGQHSPGGGGNGLSHGGLMQAILQIFGGHTGQQCPGGGGMGYLQSGFAHGKMQGQNEQHPPGGGGRGSCPGAHTGGWHFTRVQSMGR